MKRYNDKDISDTLKVIDEHIREELKIRFVVQSIQP